MIAESVLAGVAGGAYVALVSNLLGRRTARPAAPVHTDEVNDGTTFLEMPNDAAIIAAAVRRCIETDRKLVAVIGAGHEDQLCEVLHVVTFAAQANGADCRHRLVRPGAELDVEFGFKRPAITSPTLDGAVV